VWGEGQNATTGLNGVKTHDREKKRNPRSARKGKRGGLGKRTAALKKLSLISRNTEVSQNRKTREGGLKEKPRIVHHHTNERGFMGGEGGAGTLKKKGAKSTGK